MKKMFKDPQLCFILGLVGLIIAIPSENLYVNFIFIPIFIIMQITGIVFMIKNYINEKNIQKMKKTTETSNIKPNMSILMSLVSIFGSLFAVVTSLVLLMFLYKEDMGLFRYFIIGTSCIHLIIVAVSSAILFKLLKKN